MTKQEFEQILDEKLASVKPPVYKTIDDVPDYGKAAVQKLIDSKALAGTGGNTNGKANINLSYDLLRTIVILDRLGALDKNEKVAAPKAPVTTGTTTKANIK